MTNAPLALGIQTASNRLYTVDYSTGLTPPTWTILTNLTGDGTYWTLSSGTNTTKKGWYYRYRTRLP